MTDIEEKLLNLVDELRAENSALLEIIFQQQGIMPKEVVATPSGTTGTGKIPWHIRKQTLEKLYRKEEEDAGKVE
jgi:hypothetical protein